MVHLAHSDGRPPGSKHLWGPSLSWYRSRSGGSRRGEYPNGSKIKNITFMMTCANFVGPFDPFRRPAPGRPSLSWYRSRPGASRTQDGDLYKLKLGPYKCLEPGGRPWAGCLNGSN